MHRDDIVHRRARQELEHTKHEQDMPAVVKAAEEERLRETIEYPEAIDNQGLDSYL